MTPAEAKSRIAQLARDHYWTERFNNHDTAARDEYAGLLKVVVDGAEVKARAPNPDAGLAPFARDQIADYQRDPAFRQRVIAGDKDAVRVWTETQEIAAADR